MGEYCVPEGVIGGPPCLCDRGALLSLIFSSPSPPLESLFMRRLRLVGQQDGKAQIVKHALRRAAKDKVA